LGPERDIWGGKLAIVTGKFRPVEGTNRGKTGEKNEHRSEARMGMRAAGLGKEKQNVLEAWAAT